MRRKEPGKESAILRAAIDVFAEQGFHKAQMSRIAERAGVGTGTMYIYFRNKRAILHRIFGEVWQGLHADLEKLAERDDLAPIDKVDIMVDVLFDSFAAKPALAMLVSNEHDQLVRAPAEYFTALYARSLALAEKVLVEGVEKGAFSRHIDVPTLGQFLFGGLRHLLHLWGCDPETYPLNRIRQQVKQVLKHGILSTSN